MIGNRQGVIASAASGLSDPCTNRAMSLDNIFQIASMTKIVTSVAAMQLVERDLLSLDEPIDEILPELANPNVIAGIDEDGRVQLKPAQSAITLKHLLTHTSGLGYAFTSAEMANAQGEVAAASIASITSPLVFEPGTDWLYGVSTDWVGRAVEMVSGQSLGSYMDEHILGPLAMHDTGFAVAPHDEGRRVALLSRTSDGFEPFPLEIGGGEAAEFHSGGGGLYSTAADYMRFMRMLLNQGMGEGAQIVGEDSVALMSRNQVGSIRAGAFQSTVPLLSEDFDSFPGMKTDWGLGFLINQNAGPHGRAPGSLSWAGLANCYFWIDPVNDVAGLVLMQFLPFADRAALDLLNGLESAVYHSA